DRPLLALSRRGLTPAILEAGAGPGRRAARRLLGRAAVRPHPPAAGPRAGAADRVARVRSPRRASFRARPRRAPGAAQAAAQGRAARPVALRGRRQLGGGRGALPGAAEPAPPGALALGGGGPPAPSQPEGGDR